MDRDGYSDMVGGGLDRQRRLSIVPARSAKRPRTARVEHARLDAEGYIERLHRRRVRRLVQSAKRVYWNRLAALACLEHRKVLEFRHRRTLDPPRALDPVLGLSSGPVVRQHRYHERRAVAAVPSELDQTRFHAARPRV